MQEYVCGFAFNSDATSVALIRKLRPKWQAGKLNGIGGHIEENESAGAAMVREFKEETELHVTWWQQFLWLHDRKHKGRVKFYRAFDVHLEKLRSVTEERIGVYTVSYVLSLSVIPNLRWIIPLAADRTWHRRLGEVPSFEEME